MTIATTARPADDGDLRGWPLGGEPTRDDPSVVSTIRRLLPVAAAVAIAAACVAGGLVAMRTATYASTSTVLVTSGAGGVATSGDPDRLAQNEVQVLQSDDAIRRAAKKAHVTSAYLAAHVTVTQREGTNVLEVTAKTPDRSRSVALANALATVSSPNRSGWTVLNLADEASVTGPAGAARAAVLAAAVAAMATLALGFLYVEYGTSRDSITVLQETLGAPLVAVVPRPPRRKSSGRGGPSAPVRQPEIGDLRVAIESRTLGISSPLVSVTAIDSDSDSAAVAEGLAVAFADTGAETMLIKADLTGQAASRDAGFAEAISDVLAGRPLGRYDQTAFVDQLRVVDRGRSVRAVEGRMSVRSAAAVLHGLATGVEAVVVETGPMSLGRDSLPILLNVHLRVIVVSSKSLRRSSSTLTAPAVDGLPPCLLVVENDTRLLAARARAKSRR
jgi:capsular polysaccharide biosynthesis protein